VDNIRRLLGFAILSLINTTFAYATILPFMLAIDIKADANGSVSLSAHVSGGEYFRQSDAR
jgi:Sec-independent protein secretion pathway component TatC